MFFMGKGNCEPGHPYYVYFPSCYLLLPKIHCSYFKSCCLRIRFLIQHASRNDQKQGNLEGTHQPTPSHQYLPGKACTHIWQLLLLSPEKQATGSPGSANRACIQEFHRTVANKEILNGLRSTLLPIYIHPGPTQREQTKMPISHFLLRSGLTTYFPRCYLKASFQPACILVLSLILPFETPVVLGTLSTTEIH